MRRIVKKQDKEKAEFFPQISLSSTAKMVLILNKQQTVDKDECDSKADDTDEYQVLDDWFNLICKPNQPLNENSPTLEQFWNQFGQRAMYGEHEHQQISTQLNKNKILTNPKQSSTHIERDHQHQPQNISYRKKFFLCTPTETYQTS